MADERKGGGAVGPDDCGCYDWALGSGRAAYFLLTGETARLPVLAVLDGVTVEEFASGEKFFDDATRIGEWQAAVSVSPLFSERLDVLKRINYVVALVSERFFDMRNDPENRALQKAVPFALLGSPLPERLIPDTAAVKEALGRMRRDGPETAGSRETSTPTGVGSRPVVIGIIDDGIAFAHERFRNGDKTRIEYLWIQDGSPPSGFLPFGRELRAGGGDPQNDIDVLLQNSKVAGQIDEDAVYYRSKVVDFNRRGHRSLAFRATHGAAVMDIAAGRPPDTGGDDRPIIAVQLPTDAVRDTSLCGMPLFVAAGIFYILVRSVFVAARIGTAPLPVVINLSFGNIAGPHDGTSHIEQIIDWLLGMWRSVVGPVELVLPSGNSYLSRCHAKLEFPGSPPASGATTVTRLPWRVQPDDRTSSFVEIWLGPAGPPVAGDRIRVRVVAPGGSAPANATPWIGETGPPRVQYPAAGVALCAIGYHAAASQASRAAFKISLQPTESYDYAPTGPLVPTAPAGVWTIEIENLRLGGGAVVEAWIQRDDTPFTYQRLGRQSYFDSDSYVRYDNAGRPVESDDPACPIKRAGTINAIATGNEPVVLGGVIREELRPAEYSAGGPTAQPSFRPRPDALAVSDDSGTHRGVLAAGARSGSAFAFAGTSIAAPRITRWIADELAAGRPGGRQAVQTLANQYESAPNPPPNRPPVDRGGAGRILLGSVHRLPRIDPAS